MAPAVEGVSWDPGSVCPGHGPQAELSRARAAGGVDGRRSGRLVLAGRQRPRHLHSAAVGVQVALSVLPPPPPRQSTTELSRGVAQGIPGRLGLAVSLTDGNAEAWSLSGLDRGQSRGLQSGLRPGVPLPRPGPLQIETPRAWGRRPRNWGCWSRRPGFGFRFSPWEPPSPAAAVASAPATRLPLPGSRLSGAVLAPLPPASSPGV